MLASVSPSFGADFSVPVDKNFSEGSLDWTGGNSKSYTYVWSVIAVKGEVAICGAGQFRNPTMAAANKKMMRTSYVQMGDRTILKDMTFFTRVAYREPLGTAQATCRGTGIPAKDAKGQFMLVIPGGRARI